MKKGAGAIAMLVRGVGRRVGIVVRQRSVDLDVVRMTLLEYVCEFGLSRVRHCVLLPALHMCSCLQCCHSGLRHCVGPWCWCECVC